MMTNQTMTGLTLSCWVVAHIFPSFSTVYFAILPFCGPNQIIQAYCDTMSLRPLVCGDSSQQFSISFAVAMFILCVPLAFISISYVFIIVSVIRMASGQVRLSSFYPRITVFYCH